MVRISSRPTLNNRRINAVRWQPFVETNIAQDCCEFRVNPSQKHRDASFIRITYLPFEVLNRNHVRGTRTRGRPSRRRMRLAISLKPREVALPWAVHLLSRQSMDQAHRWIDASQQTGNVLALCAWWQRFFLVAPRSEAQSQPQVDCNTRSNQH